MNRVEGVMPSMALCFQLEEIEADTSPLRGPSTNGRWSLEVSGNIILRLPDARHPVENFKKVLAFVLKHINKLAMTQKWSTSGSTKLLLSKRGDPSFWAIQAIHSEAMTEMWLQGFVPERRHAQISECQPKLVEVSSAALKTLKQRLAAKVSSEWILIHDLQESTDLPEPISEVRGSKDLRGSHRPWWPWWPWSISVSFNRDQQGLWFEASHLGAR